MISRYSRLLIATAASAILVAVAACSGQNQAISPTHPVIAHKQDVAGQGACDSSIAANFNGTPVAAGNTLWFSAVMKVKGLNTTTKTTINLTSSTITFTANGTPYSVTVPDSAVTFDPAATSATVSFDLVANRWNETLPEGLGGNFLLDAVELPLSSALPGGIKNVTWAGNFTSSPTGPTVNWQWSAAVYNQFSTDYNALGVKPVDDNKASQYQNSDHAGTPENFKAHVIGGAMGGGGSNFTGGLSGTAAVSPCAMPIPSPTPTNMWTTKAPMPTARYQMGVGVVNGILYAVGGDTNNRATEGGYVEAYDPSTDAWTTKAPLPTSRTGLAVGVVNGILYAIGGQDNLVGGGATLNTVEAYNPLTNMWTTKQPMPTARVSLAVGVVNGIIYAVGGLDASSTYVNTVEAYDPSTNMWTTKQPMPTARAYLAAGGINGVLYAVGGANPGNLDTNEGYNPSTNMWTTETSMLAARHYLAADAINNILYAVGGADAGGYSNRNEAYDPTANAWTAKAPMLTARQFLSAGVVNGVLYAVGGYNGNVLNTNEAYTP